MILGVSLIPKIYRRYHKNKYYVERNSRHDQIEDHSRRFYPLLSFPQVPHKVANEKRKAVSE